MRTYIDEEDSDKLSPEQIETWRDLLCGLLGPYALIAPVEEIQRLRDKFQEKLDRRGAKDENLY